MTPTPNIAVYWDFENIHASLCSLTMGEFWYRNNIYTKQPKLIDIDKIMDYVASLGEIISNKAYANWSFLHAYSFDLQSHSVDLIQIYPRGKHGKNGADIRIAIDVLEDCMQHAHIDSIVLISGDSDYISIAQKVRQKGKRIIGIGVQETTNQYWIKSCNEFKFYATITTHENPETLQSPEDFDLSEAKLLLGKALKMIAAKSGNHHAPRVALKPVMLRLDPSFDEANYGFGNFTQFLQACRDIIVIEETDKDHLIAFRDAAAPGEVEAADPRSAHPYELLLRKQQIRLVKPDILKVGLIESYLLFQEFKTFPSYVHFRDQLLKRLKARLPHAQESDASKLKTLIYKAFCFRWDYENTAVKLSAAIRRAEDLIERVYGMIIKRILENTSDEDEIDVPWLSEALFGDNRHGIYVHDRIADYNRRSMEVK